jgi:hypothetical protein
MVNHILNTTTFTLTCTGPGGSVSDTVDVTVDFSLLMSLSLTANPTDIASGGSSTLDWTSSGVDVCTASDSQGNTLWSGAKNLVDSEQVQNILNTTTFTLNCHPTAETFLKAYTPTSSPPIANEIVNGSFLDSARNILYVSTDGGLSAINTQGTLNPSDDVLVMTYNLTSTPDIPDDQFDYVKQTFLDEPHNLLYISTFGGGLTVINTQGTVDPSDDVREMTYNLTSTPALPSEYTTGAFLDNARHLLYISTYGGLTVINTQDTVDPSDDTLVEVYDTNVMPLIDNWVNQSFLDTDHNLLYVSGYGGGLSVINTQGTVDPADDTFVTRYNTTSTPAIAGTFLQRTLLDTMHHLLYVATEGGLSVINTQNTIDPADDTLVTTYNASSTPALGGDVIQNVFLDVSHNHVYVLAEGGMYVINTQGTVSVADDTIDKTYGTPGLLPELHPNRVTMLDGTLDAAHNILYVATTRGLFAVGQSADISDTATVTVSGGGGPAPTVTLDANPTSIVEGSSSTLTWSTTDATSCTASDDQGSTLWSGAKATSGSEQVQNIPSTTVFQLSCTGPGGQASDTATVTAVPVTLSVVANPHTVNLGTLTATGRTTPTATTVTVATNNPAGYQLLWSASSAHLVHAQGAGHGTIQPLVPSTPGVPALWDSSASTTAWGAHLGAMSSVVDTDRWGSGDDYTNGKWLNVPTSPTELLRHTAATNGDTEYLYFGAEVGANVWQPSGTYTTDITLTAVTL